MDSRTIQEEVDRNFEEFNKELPKLINTYLGKYALMRNREFIGFYDTAVDALTSANQLFSDGLFSIQRVTDKAIDLGFYSHAMHLGAA
jgi:hypothetical protein